MFTINLDVDANTLHQHKNIIMSEKFPFSIRLIFGVLPLLVVFQLEIITNMHKKCYIGIRRNTSFISLSRHTAELLMSTSLSH